MRPILIELGIEAAADKANTLCHLLKQTEMREVVRYNGDLS
jgi:hypothetical protein